MEVAADSFSRCLCANIESAIILNPYCKSVQNKGEISQ